MSTIIPNFVIIKSLVIYIYNSTSKESKEAVLFNKKKDQQLDLHETDRYYLIKRRINNSTFMKPIGFKIDIGTNVIFESCWFTRDIGNVR